MKKYFLSLIILIIAILGYYAYNKQNDIIPTNKPEIKIGIILPLTGDAAESGQAAKEALEMTLENITKTDSKYDYKLIFENNLLETMRTVTISNKFINYDKVQAIFSMWTPTTGEVASVSNPKKIINMACSWEDDSISGAYTFNTISTQEQIADLLITELKKNNIKTVAILIDNSAEPLFKVIKRKLSDTDIKIVFDEVSMIGNNDFKTSIIKANQFSPDLYITAGLPPMPFILTKQLGEITGKRNITGIDSFMEMSEEQRPIANGLWYIDSNVNGNKKFVEELQNKKNIEAKSCSGNLSASLQILVDAFENTHLNEGETIPNNENVVSYIKSNTKNFPTVSGKASFMNDNIINIPPLVRKVEAGKIVEAY